MKKKKRKYTKKSTHWNKALKRAHKSLVEDNRMTDEPQPPLITSDEAKFVEKVQPEMKHFVDDRVPKILNVPSIDFALHGRIAQMESNLGKALTALQFYARKENWLAKNYTVSHQEVRRVSPIQLDQGFTALKVLSDITAEKDRD